MRNRISSKKLLIFTLILGVLSCQNPFPEKEIRSYDRNVMIEYFTATWCTNCENITESLEEFEEERSDVVIVSYHPYGSDPLGTDVWIRKDSVYNIESFPTVIFDGIERFVGGGTSYSQIINAYDKNKSEKSPMKMDILTSGDTVFVNINTDEEREGYLHLLLLEDSLKSIGYDSIYNNVVRAETLFEVELQVGINDFNLILDMSKIIESSNGEVVSFFEEKGKILQSIKTALY